MILWVSIPIKTPETKLLQNRQPGGRRRCTERVQRQFRNQLNPPLIIVFIRHSFIRSRQKWNLTQCFSWRGVGGMCWWRFTVNSAKVMRNFFFFNLNNMFSLCQYELLSAHWRANIEIKCTSVAGLWMQRSGLHIGNTVLGSQACMILALNVKIKILGTVWEFTVLHLSDSYCTPTYCCYYHTNIYEFPP